MIGEDPRRKESGGRSGVGGRGWRKVENGRLGVANWGRMRGHLARDVC